MTRVVAIRPGVTRNRSAFDAMTLIYEHLQKHHNYQFTIAHSTKDDFEHPTLRTVELPPVTWKPTIPNTPIFLRIRQYRNNIDPLIQSADVVLTVDPTIFYQGALAINRAHKHDTPVWYDASKTIADPDPHWYGIRPLVKRAVDRSTGIIATVPKVMERYSDLGIFDEEVALKITIMGHPVDTKHFSPTNDPSGMHSTNSKESPVTVIAMTRLVPEKGAYYILEAMDPLLKSNIAELQLLGEGPMKGLLKKETEYRGIESNVDFLETINHHEVPTLLRDADIFVNHAVSIDSWEEYFGAANLEAMSCGLPTVVTTSGGIPYVIRNQNAVKTVAQRDVHQLRDTIERLVHDPVERNQLGNAGRRYVQQNYSVGKIAHRYHEMIQSELSS